jgi:hypothetical protein
MFSFRKNPAPKLLPSNPGIGVAGNVGFANRERSWNERYDLIDLLELSLRTQGYPVKSEQGWLLLSESEFILCPQLVQLQPLEKGGVRTVTTIQTNHPWLVPNGTFEYQHSTGDCLDDSFRSGFEQWIQTDLVTLLDALRPNPKICTVLKWNSNESENGPGHVRRAVFGPVSSVVQYPPQQVSGTSDANHLEPGTTHEFCPCCLLTNSFEAFRELIEGNGFYALRMFAMRDQSGTPQADCRVNGNDFQKGAEALRDYANSWPKHGFEFRKQYVVLQNFERNSESPTLT